MRNIHYIKAKGAPYSLNALGPTRRKTVLRIHSNDLFHNKSIKRQEYRSQMNRISVCFLSFFFFESKRKSSRDAMKPVIHSEWDLYPLNLALVSSRHLAESCQALLP